MTTSSYIVDVPASRRGGGVMPAVVLLLLLLILGVASWATDFLMLQGESTVYTASCVDGQWAGNTCNGRLKAGERFRFRALKAHREVLFWTVGDNAGESGHFRNCVVEDGRNWSCPATGDLARTITHRMTKGHPVEGVPGALDFHHIPKWQWVALDMGLPVTHRAIN